LSDTALKNASTKPLFKNDFDFNFVIAGILSCCDFLSARSGLRAFELKTNEVAALLTPVKKCGAV